MATLETIAVCLEKSLTPQHARTAEEQLRQWEAAEGFPITLLHVVASTNLAPPVRQAGAVFFKNLVRRRWTDEDGTHLLSAADVEYIKREIVAVMIVLPALLQTQIGEAIAIIADSDFPHRWHGLIDELVARLSPSDFLVNRAVLLVAHAIFKKWRALFRSDELFLEIKHVLDKFAAPFLQLLQSVDEKVQAVIKTGTDSSNSGPASLGILLDNLLLLVQIYHDLNCQDIPEFFEDNLTAGMAIMHKYLALQTTLVGDPHDDDEADVLIKIKTSIVELVLLHVSRYADVFAPLIHTFITTVWELLVGLYVTAQPKYDLLVVKLLGFLTLVTKHPDCSALFNAEGAITEIIEKIILPNVYMRPADEEVFEDEPLQYVRSDLEGSDFDTRRKSATDFLRELKDVNAELVTATVMRYVEQFLQRLQHDWRHKDTAVYLFLALAAKGAVTNAGVTLTNVLVDVVKFFTDNVATDLGAKTHPVLKTDAVRYIYTFRNQLTKAQLLETFPMLFAHLQDANVVVYTYTALTIEKLLLMTTFEGAHAAVFGAADIAPFAQDLLLHLFALVRGSGGATALPQQLSENEFLVKCVMRVLMTAQGEVLSAAYEREVLEQLLAILEALLRNPANPRFLHYVFELLALCLKYAHESYIELVLPALLAILGNDVQEFVPYTFQVLAFMLEELPKLLPLPALYHQLVKPLLLPSVWEFRGNIPGVTRLLVAILQHDPASFELEALTPLLGVFQKLIALRANDAYGFDLLEAILLRLPPPVLAPYLLQVAVLLLTRLKALRTEKYVKRLALFVFRLACVALNPALTTVVNASFAIDLIDLVQLGVFLQIYTAFILPAAGTFANQHDKKVATLGLLELVCSPQFSSQYRHLVVPSVEQLLTNVNFIDGLQKQKAVAAGNAQTPASNELDLESAAFGATFSKIVCIQPSPFDPVPDVKSNDHAAIKRAVAANLKKVDPAAFAEISAANQQVLAQLS